MMSTFQHNTLPATMLNPSLKRSREVEDELDRGHVPAFQQKKKPRPLPLHPSPALKSIEPSSRFRSSPSAPPSSTLTPAESSEDDLMHDDDEHKSNKRDVDTHFHAFTSMRVPHAEADSDSDLEMIDSQPRSASMQPLWSAGSGTFRPESSLESPIPSFLLSQSLNVSGGRTATPIFSHFTANMNTEAMMKDNRSPVQQQHSGASPPTPADETVWWRRRRLPSPISEDETRSMSMGSNESPKPQTQPGGEYLGPYTPTGIRISITPAQVDLQSSNNTHCQTRPTSAPLQAHESFGREDGPFHTPIAVSRPSSRPAANERPSKATISMGFRADCEKCRQRVPGHYSHIIRS